jgi:arginyl-tRNA synthetase
MDFDFAKVVEASKDNPVFYVQYAHARIQSTLRKAEVENLSPSSASIKLLGNEEIALIQEAANFPRIVEAAAKAGEPHRIAFYLGDLAASFHSYWNLGNDDPSKRFILAQEPELTSARLFLASNIGQVLRNGLRLMGVEAAYSM